MNYASWISPKATKGKPSRIHGLGLVANADISKGEVVAIKSGQLISTEELIAYAKVINHSETQIMEDVWLAPLSEQEEKGSMIYINHSCDANTFVDGQLPFVALRDIKAGEEITVDYGTEFDREDTLIEKCSCFASDCRGKITGKDRQLLTVQEKYKGKFSWLCARKLADSQ